MNDYDEYSIQRLDRLVKKNDVNCAISHAHHYVSPIRTQQWFEIEFLLIFNYSHPSSRRVSCSPVAEKETLSMNYSPWKKSYAVEGRNGQNGKEVE